MYFCHPPTLVIYYYCWNITLSLKTNNSKFSLVWTNLLRYKNNTLNKLTLKIAGLSSSALVSKFSRCRGGRRGWKEAFAPSSTKTQESWVAIANWSWLLHSGSEILIIGHNKGCLKLKKKTSNFFFLPFKPLCNKQKKLQIHMKLQFYLDTNR